MESASAMASGLEANSCQVPSSSGHIWGQREADISTKKVGSKKAGDKKKTIYSGKKIIHVINLYTKVIGKFEEPYRKNSEKELIQSIITPTRFHKLPQ